MNKTYGFLVAIFLFLILGCKSPQSNISLDGKDGRKNISQEEVREVFQKPELQGKTNEENFIQLPKQDIEPKLIAGDIIEIEITDEPQLNRKFAVPNGKVYFPLIETLEVRNKTVTELTEELRKKLSGFLVSPSINITVQGWKARKIYVFGEAGSEEVLLDPNELMTAVRLLAKVGVSIPAAKASEIKVVRRNGNGENVQLNLPSKDIFDHYEFEKDIVLQPDDFVVIQAKDDVHVYITGEVGQPGKYPLLAGEELSLWDLLVEAQGPRATADLDKVKIVRKDKDGSWNSYSISVTLEDDLDDNIYLQPNDLVTVTSKAETKVATVYGEVRAPGTIPLPDGDIRISKVIALAGGVTEFASSEILVFRYPKSGGVEKFSLNYNEVLSGDKDKDILIQAGDVVYITPGLF